MTMIEDVKGTKWSHWITGSDAAGVKGYGLRIWSQEKVADSGRVVHEKPDL